jgi:hypothetical protein
MGRDRNRLGVARTIHMLFLQAWAPTQALTGDRALPCVHSPQSVSPRLLISVHCVKSAEKTRIPVSARRVVTFSSRR